MPDRPRTRSQASQDDIEQQQEDSSGDEGLDNTVVNTDAGRNDRAGAMGTIATPTTRPRESTIPSAQAVATPEVWATLVSTMTSLKSAVDDLRQESCRNRSEINSIRSQITAESQLSAREKAVEHSAQTLQEGMSPRSAECQHLPHTSSNCQSILPTSQPQHNWSQNLPNYVQQLPPLTRAYVPPSSNFQQSPPSNFQHLPPSSNLQQLSSSSSVQQLPPSSNLQVPTITDNLRQIPPPSITLQHLPPPLNYTQYRTPPLTEANFYSASAPTTMRNSEFTTKLYHLPQFDGNPEDWPLFLATYEDTSIEFGYNNRQNLMRLQKALQGAARRCVMSMLIYPENVPQIIDELRFNFGRPELLIRSQLEKIKTYPTITEGRLDGILGLATCAKNIVAFFKSVKLDNHLMNPTLLEQLVLKLPLSKQYEWAKFSAAISPFSTVEDFARWIGELARFCSLMPQRGTVNTSDRQQSSTMTTRRVLYSKEEWPNRKECLQCGGSHEITECKQFKELATSAKWDQVKRFRLCFSCLRKGHNLTQCKTRKICNINGCSRYHHLILHQDVAASSEVNNTEQSGHMLQCRQDERTPQLFKILPVVLYGPRGATTVYALLDEGSSVSLLDENVAKSMGLKGQKSSITLQWYDNMRKTESSMKVSLEISPANGCNKKYVIRNLHTVKELNLPVQSFDRSGYEYLKNLPIESYEDEKPSILIGLDNCMLGLSDQVVEAGPHRPVAAATRLGWVVYGPTLERPDSIARICHMSECSTWKEIHELVQDYFSVENFGVRATDIVLESEDNKRARNILENSTRKIDGQYETGLLWRRDDTVLPGSFEMAKQRLVRVENKMKRNTTYATNYMKEIEKYVSKGYARLLSPTEAETDDCDKLWYLPHFGVISPHKPEKLRIVFDAAATSSGISLNSVLLKGPERTRPLQTILYQFRQGQIAVAGDIQEMFNQVAIGTADQNSQRFLWREGGMNGEIRTYVMQSMIFGAVCSPCCAEYVKNVNARSFESIMPRGADAIINHMYVDDLVISFDSKEEAVKVMSEAKQINAAAGFNLRHFSSNCFEIESGLNGDDEGGAATIKLERQDQTDKILGLYWNKGTDSFEFHVKFHKICPDVLEGRRPPTKREILGIVMAIFDPFGFLANFTIFSKLLIQKTWKLCLQWDDQLPQPVLKPWNDWWKEFEKVKEFSIPRCYSKLLVSADQVQLHIFVDASSSAYAAVAYLRMKHRGDIHVSFVVAKARCAPPRGMTIPRLELQAAVLGCRLKTSIEECHKFSIDRTIFWSDSKTVICWIRSTEREYKQFVACRIAEILTSTEPEQWRWLPTDLNVADEATRAKISVTFAANSRWLKGPAFLKHDEELWPADPCVSEASEGREEVRVRAVLMLNSVRVPILNYNQFSDFLRFKRCAAWVLRFINVRVRKFELRGTELTAAEIEAGEKLICRQVQIEVFGAERTCLTNGNSLPKSYAIYSLTPYLDEDMLLRVNGRINNAYYLPETARNPIIMPTKHPLTLMIIDYCHRRRHHQNDLAVINEVRQKFWVPCIRSALRSVKQVCSTCIRDRAKPIPPLMGQLPVDRVTPYVRPFSYVGVDYCGPFYVTIGRRREKRWIALFTCLGTRALHLEISVDLSTDAFLLCLRNFVNRRGVPVRIRSDNGTNFVGAQKEMKQNNFFDHDEIQRNLFKDNVEWIFNCPANPHAGGCWERLVRCVKQLLHKIFKEEAPRLETFRSAVTEAECIINDRPLTQLPIDPDSEEPLTPNHFLIGGLSFAQTPGPDNEKVCLRKQWRIAQNLKDRLWRRWVVEYLPQLLKRPKWRDKAEPLQIGDIALILEPSQFRGQWKMGRIKRVFSGKDGQVRSAEVQTATGLLRRPAVRLAVIKVKESSP